MLLAKFRLPGESQKIERIMEAFAKHYYNYNKGHPFEGLPFMSSNPSLFNDNLHFF